MFGSQHRKTIGSLAAVASLNALVIVTSGCATATQPRRTEAKEHLVTCQAHFRHCRKEAMRICPRGHKVVFYVAERPAVIADTSMGGSHDMPRGERRFTAVFTCEQGRGEDQPSSSCP